MRTSFRNPIPYWLHLDSTGQTTKNCIIKNDEGIQYKDEYGLNMEECNFEFPTKNNNDKINEENLANLPIVGGGDEQVTPTKGGGVSAISPKPK